MLVLVILLDILRARVFTRSLLQVDFATFAGLEKPIILRLISVLVRPGEAHI